jgi:protein SCO1/2
MPPDETKTRGRVVPDIVLTDDHGVSFCLGEMAGKPLFLSPIFTRCPGACIAITTSLRDAIQGAGTIGRDFNVITISFDPADSLQTMRAYREAHALPDAWRMVVAEPEDRMRLLDAIDFNFMSLDGGMFAHANEVAVLDRNLAVSGYLHGTVYAPEEVVSALQVAGGKKPGLFSHPGNRVFLIGVAGILAAALAIIAVLTRRAVRDART